MPTRTNLARAAAATAAALLAAWARPALVETREITVAKEFGIGYLPYLIMEHEKLVEKQAKARGLGDLKVTWKTFGGSGFTESAMIAGQVQFASSGVPWFLLLWDKTNGDVKAVGALDAMPLYLNTRNPRVKSIADFREGDKIALPAIKSSIQAITLQMAAARAFGPGQAAKLDPLTVSLSHPDAMTALLSGRSEIDAHFTSPPFQDLELKDPHVHRVLSSYEVLDGAATAIIASTTTKFAKANPKTFEAFVAALEEAHAFIGASRREAARIYLEMSGDKHLSEDEIVELLGNPDYRFTLVPEGMMKYASFMASTGSLKKKPADWKDLCFPHVHALPGS
ncbi:MAG TPA: ABC transporter substrate-binding protein [Anaeromyxobacter sp.]|nr:ABC transporter substrate-binding protein [Anaeromyxobacter sp.]